MRRLRSSEQIFHQIKMIRRRHDDDDDDDDDDDHHHHHHLTLYLNTIKVLRWMPLKENRKIAKALTV